MPSSEPSPDNKLTKEQNNTQKHPGSSLFRISNSVANVLRQMFTKSRSSTVWYSNVRSWKKVQELEEEHDLQVYKEKSVKNQSYSTIINYYMIKTVISDPRILHICCPSFFFVVICNNAAPRSSSLPAHYLPSPQALLFEHLTGPVLSDHYCYGTWPHAAVAKLNNSLNPRTWKWM